MNYEIVPVTEEMLDTLEEMEKECFSVPWSREMLLYQMRGNNVFLAAVNGGEVMGYIGMMFVLDEGYISNVAVSPEHRRRGIADLLLSYLHAEAEKLSLSFVSLEVRASNAPALSLYSKHGYIEEGRRKNYYSKPREDAVIMTVRWGAIE